VLAQDCIRLNHYDRLMQAADRHYDLGRQFQHPAWCERASFLAHEASTRCMDLIGSIEREALYGVMRKAIKPRRGSSRRVQPSRSSTPRSHEAFLTETTRGAELQYM
jgi:hypothetical protein